MKSVMIVMEVGLVGPKIEFGIFCILSFVRFARRLL